MIQSCINNKSIWGELNSPGYTVNNKKQRIGNWSSTSSWSSLHSFYTNKLEKGKTIHFLFQVQINIFSKCHEISGFKQSGLSPDSFSLLTVNCCTFFEKGCGVEDSNFLKVVQLECSMIDQISDHSLWLILSNPA